MVLKSSPAHTVHRPLSLAHRVVTHFIDKHGWVVLVCACGYVDRPEYMMRHTESKGEQRPYGWSEV